MSENQEKDNNRREEELLVPMEQAEPEEFEDEFEDEDELDRIPLEEEPILEEGKQKEFHAEHPKGLAGSSEKTSEYGLGMTAMILGILSLLFFCIPLPGLVLAAFAVVLGIVAAARKNGKKMGTSGIIMGGIALVSYLLIILLFGGAFQLLEQNRDYLTDTAWRRTTDGSVLYLYQDGTFIDVEKEGIFSDNFYSGTYDILPYEDAGLSFGSLESQYDTRYAYDVCLYVDSYVVNGEERETIASTIRYLYFFERNYGTGDIIQVCAHDTGQYGNAYPVKETDMAYPSLGNQYIAGEAEDSTSDTGSESLSEDTGTESDGGVDTEADITSDTAFDTASDTEIDTASDTVSGTENNTASENVSTASTADENHFWGDMEQFIDNSKKNLEEFSSSALEEWEKNSEEISSAAEEISSAVEEAGSSIEEAGSSAVEELEEKVDEDGIRKAFRNLIQWLKNILAGWGF